MATLDIFNEDPFKLIPLTQAIIDIPRVPTQLGDEGLFSEQGLVGTVMWIERKGSSIQLVPTAPRGGVGQSTTETNRKMIPVGCVHLPQYETILADAVLGVRAFGKEAELETIQGLVNQKLAAMKANLDLTLEYQRIGALKGQVLDADGTTVVWDMYQIFNFTQETKFWNIATPSTSVDLKQFCIDLKRSIRNSLGGKPFKKVRVKCSEGFFDKLVGHDKMKAAWELWNNGQFARTTQVDGDFEFSDVIFQIYSGGTSAGDFIADGLAYAYPEGVPNMFQIWYGSGDYTETVNQMGLPYYAKQERKKFDKGVDLEAQSNPLTINTLPEAVKKLSVAAS